MSEIEFWADCPLTRSDPEIVHGEPVFVGTRLPGSAVLDNLDGYLEDGLSLDEAIKETLESFRASLRESARFWRTGTPAKFNYSLEGGNPR